MKTVEGIFEDIIKVSIYFHLFFLVRGGGEIWSSTHTLGPILKRKTPKCPELNYLQFCFNFIKILSTSSRKFFKKRVRVGETAARPPSTPQKFPMTNLVGQPIPYK